MSEPLHRARALLAVGAAPSALEALEEFDAEIEAFGLQDDPFAASSWPIVLEVLRRAEQPEQAIAKGSRWTRQARKHGWTSSLSQVLTRMGNCALDLNDLDRAMRWFEEAQDAGRRSGDLAAAANAALGEARAWEIRGEDERCLELAERAQADARKAQDGLVTARALNVAAKVRIRRGEDEAVALLEEAEQLCASVGANADRIQVMLDKLPVAFKRGDLDAAEEVLTRASTEADLIGDSELRGRIALDLGELHRTRGDRNKAREQYQKALEILPAGRPLVRIAKLNMALADLEDGKRKQVVAGIDVLLHATRGNRFLTGVTHLLGLASGPANPTDEEDAVWARHGTPARLALGSTLVHNDLRTVARTAAERMVKGADRIQAGRAALVMGLQQVEDAALVERLRQRGAALPIGPYLTVARLGVGGMGTVWLARHVDRDRPAAVKVLNAENQESAFAWGSLDTELRAVSTLSHPNIVRLLDHGRVGFAAGALSAGRINPHSPYLALEFVPGGALTPWIGRLSWAGVRNVLDDLLSALAHAHAHRVLHLDLKPDNILLANRSDPLAGVKLVDFGLALFRSASRDIFAGTPQFMAPEQVQKAQEYGPWTDLYAIGCLAWTMVTGSAPFDHPDRTEMARLHVREPPPPFEPIVDTPAGFEGWVRQLLAKRIDERPDRASLARAALLSLAPSPKRSSLPTFTALPDAGLALVQEKEPDLVGRQLEREQLWAVFTAATRPTRVDIGGPLGSGRRALMAWLATQTHEDGLSEVLVHDASTGFEALVGEHIDPALTAASILSQFVRRRRERTGLLLLDGQDPACDAVAKALMQSTDMPLVVVVRQLPTHATGTSLQLSALPDDVMRTVVGSILPLAHRLESALVTWAAGNPGLAVATLRSLGREGELRPTLDGWDVPHPRPFRVPAEVGEALDQSLRLDPDGTEALEIAAAIGSSVSLSQWTKLHPDAPSIGAKMVKAGVFAMDPAGRDFHWIQPAAKHRVAQRPATRLAHARIAEQMQKVGAVPHLIAHHFVQARRYADAHRPLLDAVKAAIEVSDLEAANRWMDAWEDALERLAVGKNDPRRLAGARLASRLERE